VLPKSPNWFEGEATIFYVRGAMSSSLALPAESKPAVGYLRKKRKRWVIRYWLFDVYVERKKEQWKRKEHLDPATRKDSQEKGITPHVLFFSPAARTTGKGTWRFIVSSQNGHPCRNVADFDFHITLSRSHTQRTIAIVIVMAEMGKWACEEKGKGIGCPLLLPSSSLCFHRPSSLVLCATSSSPFFHSSLPCHLPI